MEPLSQFYLTVSLSSSLSVPVSSCRGRSHYLSLAFKIVWYTSCVRLCWVCSLLRWFIHSKRGLRWGLFVQKKQKTDVLVCVFCLFCRCRSVYDRRHSREPRSLNKLFHPMFATSSSTSFFYMKLPFTDQLVCLRKQIAPQYQSWINKINFCI